ncbi:hypothetical protein GCM10023097_01270 [Streptomyces collinus]
MPEKLDSIFDLVHPILSEASSASPWTMTDKGPSYEADTALLEKLLAIPVEEGADSQSGRLAKALDAWAAHELRRAGFDADEVWPRRDAPRVLPREVGIFISKLPQKLRTQVQPYLVKDRATAPSNASILGKAYVKQVDVVVAQWARGPEILISTKTMASSFAKNLPNRFEEAYGDAKNLRGRHPLAAIGFVFLLHSSVQTNEPASYERALDMLRKLRAEYDVYDSTAVLMADWTPGDGSSVHIRHDLVPEDLSINQFFSVSIDAVLARTPIDMHVQVRERREIRELPVQDEDVAAQHSEGTTSEGS